MFCKTLCCLLLASSMMGCAAFKSKEENKEAEFQDKKITLEHDCELLSLQKRKLILQKQIDALSSLDLELKIVPK